jgi:translation initiation factor 3 subunit I
MLLQNGAVQAEYKQHDLSVSSFAFNEEKTLLVTSSHDRTAKLWDVKEMKVLRTYEGDVPLNAAVITPRACVGGREHVVVGGGQEAMAVTTTAAAAGKFEARFYHMILGTELGRIKGHFGPINTLAFAPHGRAFASGGEDGYIRLHHLDGEYDGLGEEADLEDPALLAMLRDGTLARLEAEEAELRRKAEEAERAALAAAGKLSSGSVSGVNLQPGRPVAAY